jgi:hypothetical protein
MIANVRNTLSLVSMLSALLAFQCGAVASVGDEAIGGRVRSGAGGNLRVCFDHGKPVSAGQEFDVVRHTVRTLPKGLTTLDSEKVGVIRISAIDADQCASAVVVRGSAHAWDWVAIRPQT